MFFPFFALRFLILLLMGTFKAFYPVIWHGLEARKLFQIKE